MPPRFERPDLSTDEGGLWAMLDRRWHVIHYSAPRLGFYPRHQAAVERLVQSARLRS